MTRSNSRLLTLSLTLSLPLWALLACGRAADGGGEGSTEAEASVSGSEGASASSSSEAETSSESSGCGFAAICDLAPGECGPQCSTLDPGDCGPGYKCTATNCGAMGSSWDANTCVPIGGEGELGEPCRFEGDPLLGNDDCAEGLMCFNVDAETGVGACWAFCTGDIEDPQCPEMHSCALSSDSTLTLCLRNCDPLEQDCSETEQCVPETSGDGFACVLDASEGAHPYGSPCEYVNICNPGLACVDASSVPEPSCEGAAGCCTPYCDLDNPGSCPGAGQSCEPWFNPPAPAGYEHVGVCVVL